ncbi:hypothetical protein M0802_004876 [Mischocyttarus mexicanus]|nr:hypothetical protein M0802_004876 [Mischocyttarus mexicanus]
MVVFLCTSSENRFLEKKENRSYLESADVEIEEERYLRCVENTAQYQFTRMASLSGVTCFIRCCLEIQTEMENVRGSYCW